MSLRVLAFFVVHLSMVIAHGEISAMGLIVLGDIHQVHGALGLVVGLAGLAGIVAARRRPVRHDGGRAIRELRAGGGRVSGTPHAHHAAYEMNGRPLPVPHGAPLRLRVETQLGFTMVKYIRRIEFVHDYRQIGRGQGGWREDQQSYSREAGI